MECDGGGVEVFGDVFEGEVDVEGARREEALGAGDLFVEKLVADAGGVAAADAEGAADAGQQDLLRASARQRTGFG